MVGRRACFPHMVKSTLGGPRWYQKLLATAGEETQKVYRNPEKGGGLRGLPSSRGKGGCVGHPPHKAKGMGVSTLNEEKKT